MKKKIFLMLAMMLIASCLLVISVSATVTKFENEPERTKIQILDNEIIEFKDGFKCPSAYVFKDQTSVPARTAFEDSMDFTYVNEQLGKTGDDAYTYADVKGFDIPSGYTYIGIYAGMDARAPSWITFPNTVAKLDGAIFQNSSTLEECTFKFTEDNPNKKFPGYTFYGCKKLKAFSMPDCFTEIADVVNFYNCNTMTALYLSKNLTTWNTIGGGSGATFDGCNKMYFVNEPFTYDNIPERPTVYYFPANLTSREGVSNDFSVQSAMRNCYDLNDVMVFGEKVTVMSNAYFFQNIGACKIVFLADMTSVATQYWGKASQIIFTHPNDKTAADVNYSGNKTAVFCNAEDNTTHLAEKTLDVPAQCEIDAGKYTYCFCGSIMDKEAIEGTALEHDLDYVNSTATLISVSYADLSKDGTKIVKCALCNADKEAKADKIFDYKGYSKNDKGGFCMGYIVNQAALKDYEAKNIDVTYGFVASANNDAPLNADGTAKDNVVKADLSSSSYTSVDFILTADNWEAENVASAKITLNMYVIVNNAVKYITLAGYSDTAEAYKYSDIA